MQDNLPILVPGTVPVMTTPAPFPDTRRCSVVTYGSTITEIIVAQGVNPPNVCDVTLGGSRIESKYWGLVKPKEGHLLIIRYMPAGGEGSKDIIRTVSTIAVLAIAVAIAGPGGLVLTGWKAALVIGGITAAGTFAVNALIRPPGPSRAASLPTNDAAQSVFSLTGTQNKANPFGVIPQVLGKHRMFPPYAAVPYTEILGDDQFLRLLFTFGKGELEITDLKIGETDIDLFEDVEYEVRTGTPSDADVTIYTQDIHEESLSVLMTKAGGFVQRTTKPNTDEISVDVVFTSGLFSIDTAGRRVATAVKVNIEYRPSGPSGSWTIAGQIIATEETPNVVRRGLRWTVTRGQYDVRVERVTADATDDSTFDVVAWSALRSITHTPPVTEPNLALVAIRIRATEQLSGILDAFNAVVQTVALDWNGSSWVSQPTSNPASLFRHVLQGEANSLAVADDRVDLLAIQAWADECIDQGREHNAVLDIESRVFEVLNNVAAVGRASLNMNTSGQFSVVRDVPQTVPIQVITPQNSSGYTGAKIFNETLHAFKVRFINAAAGYVQDEITVYDDGFDINNATKFEGLELHGVTDADQAWRAARYFLAVARLRPERHEVILDPEFLVCTRGDLVRLVHDVPLLGVTQDRIKTVTNPSGTTWRLAFTNSFTVEAFKIYGLAVRRPDGDVLEATVIDPGAGVYNYVEYDEAVAVWGEQPAPGDLLIIGESGAVGVDMIVKSVEPASDLSAKLVLIDAAPGVHTADTGPIPAFDPHLTPINIAIQVVLPPTIESVRSDNDHVLTGGVHTPRVIIGLGPPRIRYADHTPSVYQVQVRETAESVSNWVPQPDLPGSARQVIVSNVEQGVSYDIRIRSVTAVGQTSDWALISTHVVIGSGTKPPDVVNTRVEGTWLTWDYPDPPDDLAGFRVRFINATGTPASWAQADPAHERLISDNYFTLFDLMTAEGPSTFLVKAEDTDGNQSPTAAIAVLNLGDFRELNRAEMNRTDLHNLGYPGTIVDGAVVSTDLQADPIAGAAVMWSPNAGLLMWGDPAAPMWSGATPVYEQMTYTFDLTPAVVPSHPRARLIMELTIQAESFTIERRVLEPDFFWAPADTDLMWAPADTDLMWTGSAGLWKAWRGSLIDLKRQAYQMRIITAESITRGKISNLSLVIQGGSEEELFEDLQLPASGLRLPIAKPYNGIRQVSITLQDDGGAAVNVRVIDKDPFRGPLVQAIDKDSVATGGLIDALIKGF